MVYSTPSPSDSWESSFSDGGGTPTSNTTWNGSEFNAPITPPTPSTTVAKFHKLSITSAPIYGMPSPSSSSLSSSAAAAATATAATMHSAPSSLIPVLPPTAEVRGRKYVEDKKDWIQHRERITHMYLVQKQTLKEIIAHMERAHGFVATERMYKAHFSEWGVKKNVTIKIVRNLLQAMDQASTQCPPGTNDLTTILDIDKDIDVKKIQKYMKRKPLGLDALRKDPKRPLDKIKALNVDNGKSRSGRGKVSIATAKLKDQRPLPRFHDLTPPASSSAMMLPWSSPESGLPDSLPHDMTQLLHTAVEHEFCAPHPSYPCSPPLPVSPASSYVWQPHNPGSPTTLAGDWTPDEVMLGFANRLRIAHMLLDDGLPRESFEVTTMCLNLLSTRFQQTQQVVDNNRASCMVLLYAFTAALEMASCFNHRDMLNSLFQHIHVLCTAQLPRLAEMAKRLPQLDPLQQVSLLKLAHQMMSTAALGSVGYDNPGYEVYSRTVDISIGLSSPEEKLRALRALAADPVVKETPLMSKWLEKRIALAVGDAPWAAQQQGLLSSTTLWEHNGESKMALVLYYASDCIERFKAAGDWEQVHKWATEGELVALMSLGYGHELSRKFHNDLEQIKLGSPIHGLPAVDYMQININMNGFKHDADESVSMPVPVSAASSSPGWGSPVAAQAHGRETTLRPLWDMAGAGVMDNGAGLYDNSFCKPEAPW